jgi:AcrR family transcriptional regulator
VNVPAKRAYASPLRDDQARATHRAIVNAAADLFQRNGYAATTIAAIAAAAGVSRKTVFASGGSKFTLLKDAFDWSFAEIAARNEIPVGTAKCYAHRARSSLRNRLANA